jgi:Tfp pilus assembly protein PilF
VVYCRSLDVPFIFDDKFAIAGNDSIRSLWPLVGTADERGPLNPSPVMPTVARPLVNLSFAINYHFGGLKPAGYHAVNIILHFLNAVLIFAIVRRSLRQPYFAGGFGRSAGWLSLAVSVLWAVHPLQTESVVYVTQRSELMMAMFYLATLYCSMRYWAASSSGANDQSGVTANGSQRERISRAVWLSLAVLSCLCGMASKEVMISAPLIVLLFERTFVAGSLRNALRRSWPVYLGLAATWLPALGLWFLMPREIAAGFGLGLGASEWWLTQTKVLLMYVRLAVWPWPLLIHYQLHNLTTVGESWFYVLPVLLIALTTLILLVRNRASGFLGAFAFAILLPTSAVPILLETAAERRMYLPLAAIVALVVGGGYRLFKHALGDQPVKSRGDFGRMLQRAGIAIPIIVALVYGAVSAKRVDAYHDELALWVDVLHENPNDFLAHANAGLLLTAADRVPEAMRELRIVVSLAPDDSDAVTNLAALLTKTEQVPEAIDLLQKFIGKHPKDAVAHNNLGTALAKVGRRSEAVEHFRTAAQLIPKYAEAHKNLGVILVLDQKFEEAMNEFQKALAINPNYVDALFNLGSVRLATGHAQDAISYFERAARLQPERPDVRKGFGDALRAVGRLSAAVQQYQLALQLKPDDTNTYSELMKTYSQLAASLANGNRSGEAIQTAETAAALARSHHDERNAEQIEGQIKNYKAVLQRPGGPMPHQNPSAPR